MLDNIRYFFMGLISAMAAFFSPIRDFMTAVVILFIVNFICGLRPTSSRVINSLGQSKWSPAFILNDTQKAALSATEKAVLINKGWTLA